jgi:hypothetical protein
MLQVHGLSFLVLQVHPAAVNAAAVSAACHDVLFTSMMVVHPALSCCGLRLVGLLALHIVSYTTPSADGLLICPCGAPCRVCGSFP